MYFVLLCFSIVFLLLVVFVSCGCCGFVCFILGGLFAIALEFAVVFVDLFLLVEWLDWMGLVVDRCLCLVCCFACCEFV